MSFQLVTKHSFDKEFAVLPREIQKRVADAFMALAEQPFPPGCVGDYRIIYWPDVESKIVRLLAVGHRREIYR